MSVDPVTLQGIGLVDVVNIRRASGSQVDT